ncbi:MAG: IPT/TIG domain-containing protein [Acidobacteria bacterium]|nr:IPT/TIG domain-containing protein [Acidobacteriota bacterium]
MTKYLSRKFLICLCVLIIPLFASSRVFLATYQKYTHIFVSSVLQSSTLVLTGPDRDPNPVINEGKQLQLSLLNSNGQPVTGATFTSDSPDIANVDAQTGMVAGLQRGYATITAKMGSQSVSTFIVVTRVNSSSGVKVPGDTKVDAQGAIYLSDPASNVIYKKINTNAEAKVFAGKLGSRGKDDGERSQALFSGPTAIALDNRPQGGTYVADTLNHSVRKVGFDDQVITVIGNGSPGINRNDITPFEQAAFSSPQGVVVDLGGNVYIVDTGNHAIYVADFNKKQVRLVAGQPGIASKADGQGRAAAFNRPTAISLQSASTSFFGTQQQTVLLVADTGNNRIRAVSLDGKVTTVGPINQSASQDISALADSEFEFNQPTSISVDSVGNIYVVDKSGAKLITDDPKQRQMISLAQPGVSFGQASSVVVRGNQTLVLDSNATSDRDAVKVVTVGAPQIISMTQDSDRLQGGTEIIVTGKNFAPESDVILGDAVVRATIDSSTRLRFTVPSQQAPGIRTLSIRTRGGVIQRPFRIFSDPLQDLTNGQITTFAGGVPFLGDGGDALESSLNRPEGVAVDGAGNIFVVDSSNHRIRMIDTAGVITTIAGNGVRGFTGDGTSALAASLNLPKSIALDSSGNLFIADFGNSRVRRVDAITGIITTVAGNGIRSFSGDNGLATNASLRFPQGITVDLAGNILIADTGNNRIRRVDSQTGLITTIAGNGNKTIGEDGAIATSTAIGAVEIIAVDSSNNIFFLASSSGRIRRINPSTQTITTVVGDGTKGFAGDGGAATTAKLNSPEDFKIDTLGNIFISDSVNSRIRRVDAKTGVIATVAGSGELAFGGDGGAATTSSLNLPKSIAVDGLGNLIISDTGNNRIRRVTVDGIITTIAGNGTNSFTLKGSVMDTRFDYPEAMVIDQEGFIYIADTFNNRVVVIDTNKGIADTLVGDDDVDPNLGDDGLGEEFGEDDGSNSDNDDSDGGDGDDGDDGGDDGDDGGDDGDDGDDGGDDGRVLEGSALDINLRFPSGIAVDEDNLYISDTGRNMIQRVDLNTGMITIFAGTGASGFSGDNGLATKARLNSPHGLALDSEGNLFVADSDNRRIRRIDIQTGMITTIAGTGMMGSAGDGGMAKAAQFVFPRSLAIDSKGNLYIVDSDDSRVRKIDTNGIITTIAGNGMDDFSGDGGVATSASLRLPKGIVVDDAGNIFISDSENDRIRRVDVQTGIISTIAGTGTTGFSGDGNLASQARLNSPYALALDSNSSLFVLDTFNNAIRVMKLLGSSANAPDFSLNVSPVSQNIQAGGIARFSVSFNSLNGFNSAVSLATVLNPPNSGISLSLSNTSINSGQMATLTVNIASSVMPGVFSIALTGQSGSVTRQEMIRLVITPKPAGDFVLVARPAVQTVPLGAATSFNISTQAINDFSDSVSLSATVDPPDSNLRLSFSQNGVSPGASSTLTVNALANATVGDFNIIVTGTSGQIVRTQMVKLSVVQMLRPPKLNTVASQTVKPGEVAMVNVSVMDPINQMGLTLSLIGAPTYVSLTDNGAGNGVIRIAPQMGAQSGVVIVRVTNAGGLSDQTMFNITIPGSLMVSTASFTKPTLTVLGSGFGTSGAIVRVNDVDVSSTISSQADTKIELKGSKKKFGLKKGQNTVAVTVNGITSNTISFNF